MHEAPGPEAKIQDPLETSEALKILYRAVHALLSDTIQSEGGCYGEAGSEGDGLEMQSAGVRPRKWTRCFAQRPPSQLVHSVQKPYCRRRQGLQPVCLKT